jgi:hypothetical protein
MDKRQFLVAAAVGGLMPVPGPARANAPGSNPALLTVGGAIGTGNRGPVDPVLDQLMIRHGVAFSRALAFDAEQLQRLPKVEIRPTLEYDEARHKLAGPLIETVLAEAGVDPGAALRIGLRAIDGYNVELPLADVRAYRMIVATHADDRPLSLGGLGPSWAVHDADSIAAFKDKPVKQRFALCPWGLYYIHVA